MIPLSTTNYYLERVSEDFFWKELNKITAGQSLNPQFGYNRSLYKKSDRTFVGRKAGNQFSIFLYGALNRFFRSAILCNGIVSAQGRGIMIRCSFEYPLWSFLSFLILALSVYIGLGTIPFVKVPLTINKPLAGAIGIALYCLVVVYNLSRIKRELTRQLELMEEKAMRSLTDNPVFI